MLRSPFKGRKEFFMGPILLACLVALAVVMPAGAAERKRVTFCSDGALVEMEAQAVRGRVTVPLPRPLIDGTLTVTPLGNTRLVRVETVKSQREGKREQEAERLTEQKERLQDRLRALATREEIFTAAAKSQSGKAPRKTKANPDPIQSIRQGTDFAIAQLEAVYTSRRKTEHEIRRIDGRLTELAGGEAGAERLAKISVQPAGGRVRVRYALATAGWKPRYDVRLGAGGPAQLVLAGDLPEGFDGYAAAVSFGTLSSCTGESLPVDTAQGGRLAEYRLEAAEVNAGEGIPPSLSFSLSNATGRHLPPGEAAIYHQGEYRGRLFFQGISSGRSRRFALGS